MGTYGRQTRTGPDPARRCTVKCDKCKQDVTSQHTLSECSLNQMRRFTAKPPEPGMGETHKAVSSFLKLTERWQ